MKKLFLLLFVLLMGVSASAQDIIVTKDGKKTEAKVTEVEVDVIKYKKYGDDNGPTYTIKKSDISTILYENGTVDVFKDEPQAKQRNGYYDPEYGYMYDNPYIIHGKGMRNAGIILTSVGSATIIASILVSVLDKSYWPLYTILPLGIGLSGSGAILWGVGQARMNRYRYYQQQKNVYSFYDIELNKDGKYPVNLGFGVNGIALKF